jgi:hypothetical protein
MRITEAKVRAAVKRCMKHLMKKQYELNLPKSAPENALRCLKVYTRTDGRSWAGHNLLKINTKCWQFGTKEWSEYNRVAKTPVIGNIQVVDDEDILMCLVAHEISHFVQFTYRNWFPEYLKKKQKKDRGHGECFQTIYRYLRADLVNPMIESKKMENVA